MPYILQEYIDDVVELWQVLGDSLHNVCCRILDELARWHATFLKPLLHPLHSVGDLSFAPGLSATATLLGPNTYIVWPLQQPGPPLVSSVSLVHLWDQLWSYHMKLCASNDGSHIDREALDLDDDVQCDATSFVIAGVRIRNFTKNALCLLEQYPQYALPCLVNYDYAYRNILLDARTYRVKAFIDWDDVHVMPFIVGVNFPEDIKIFSIEGLSPGSNYYHEGKFMSFPPDEYGEIIGAVDKFGKLTDIDKNGHTMGVHERDERICNTLFCEQFVRALGMWDEHVTQSDMWKVWNKVLKAHHLLTREGQMWWEKRQWLGEQQGGDSVFPV